MSIIDKFIAENPDGDLLQTKVSVLSLPHYFPLDQIYKIYIFHRVIIEYPVVIEGRQLLISKDHLDPEKASRDGFVNNNGDFSNEVDEYGSRAVGAITDMDKAKI